MSEGQGVTEGMSKLHPSHSKMSMTLESPKPPPSPLQAMVELEVQRVVEVLSSSGAVSPWFMAHMYEIMKASAGGGQRAASVIERPLPLFGGDQVRAADQRGGIICLASSPGQLTIFQHRPPKPIYPFGPPPPRLSIGGCCLPRCWPASPQRPSLQ